MALYRFVFRFMTAGELVAVLNGQASLIETCVVERTLMGMIAD